MTYMGSAILMTTMAVRSYNTTSGLGAHICILDVTGSVTSVQVVREKLVALEIPFVQHTTVRGSPKRQLLVDKYGKFAVPYLEVSSACVRLHVPYRVVLLILHGKHACCMCDVR